ncbi:MAG: PEP-CTERM sorting domain-containing protein [Phycisphaerae bacterium]
MRAKLSLCSLMFVIGAAPAFAGSVFSQTAPGGDIGDNDITFFPLMFDEEQQSLAGLDVQVEVRGLSHERPDDLNIFLVDPFGASVELMDDNGNGFSVTGLDLLFNDNAAATLPDDVLLESGEYLPINDSFSIFDNTGTDAWLLVVLDDAEGNTGSFTEFEISAVPEPMTLSLLGVGGIALLRRKRQQA